MVTTKNDKDSHQKVCFFLWYVFMVMLQFSLKFFHWKLSQIFYAQCWLSIWTYWNKFIHCFFQVMTLFTMNAANVTSLFGKVLRRNLSLVSVYRQIIRQPIYANLKRVCSDRITLIHGFIISVPVLILRILRQLLLRNGTFSSK